MNIGLRIRERRKELKMSADELGKKLGKDRSTIYRYEKGDIENLPLDLLVPIADALETSPAYLMGWFDEVEVKPVETANKLLDTFLGLELKEDEDVEFLTMIDEYKQLDASKQAQVREYVHFLVGRS